MAWLGFVFSLLFCFCFISLYLFDPCYAFAVFSGRDGYRVSLALIVRFAMRKSVISASTSGLGSAASAEWLDLDAIAQVEISSEDASFPVEHALGDAVATGWRAAETGPQVIRLLFDAPQAIRRIRLHFVDTSVERGQEFAVYAGVGGELREVVRQQWTFSPQGSSEEIEDYTVDLNGVTVLELRIDPDRSHDPKQSRSYASLQSLKLG